MLSHRLSPVALLVLLVGALAAAQTGAQPKEPAAQPDVTSLATAFVDHLAKGNFAVAAAGFDDTMKALLPPEKLEAAWKSVVASSGPFKRQTSVRISESGPYTIAFVTCEFERSSFDVKLAFDDARRIAGMFFVPTAVSTAAPTLPSYARQDAFHEREVIVGTGKWALHGTLTMPKGAGPFPALVLVHGSGPNDRDESYGPNRPFRDLAWGLATRGIAVLRYEKRTKEHGAEIVGAAFETFTVNDEYVDDALSAVALLRSTAGVNPRRVFVLGHSQGGMVAPRIGQRDPKLAGLIIFAGTSRPIAEVLPEQLVYLASLDETVSDEEKTGIEQAKPEAAHTIDEAWLRAAPKAEVIFGAPPAYWRDLLHYDPTTAAKALPQPILVLRGERDYQVTAADFQRWTNALSSRANVTFKLYPKLNHFFIAGEGPPNPTEYDAPGNVAEPVVDDIAAWIKHDSTKPQINADKHRF